jgi:hypothetical protein
MIARSLKAVPPVMIKKEKTITNPRNGSIKNSMISFIGFKLLTVL